MRTLRMPAFETSGAAEPGTRLNPWLLRFRNAELEREFQAHYVERNMTFFRGGAISSALGWFASIFLIAEVAADHLDLFVRVVLFGLYPVFLATLFLSMWRPTRGLTHLFSSFCIFAGGIAVFYLVGYKIQNPTIMAWGLAMVAFYAPSIFRLRLLPTFISTLAYLAPSIVISFQVFTVGAGFSVAFLSILAFFMSMAGAYIMERNARSLFLNEKVILEQKQMLSQEKDRHDLELKLASSLQRGLFPGERYVSSRIEFCAYTRPLQAIGGDLYDVLALRRQTALFFADACGHGIPAALLVGVTKICFMEAVAQAERQNEGLLQAAELLRSINRRLETVLPAYEYITACVLVIDDAGRYTLSNAGHRPCYILNGSGELRVHEPDGYVAGLFPEAEFDDLAQEEGVLEPGDRLLFFSDGIPDAPGPDGEPWGEEPVRRWLQATRGESLERAFEQIVERWRECCEDTRNDDASLLLAEARNPIASRTYDAVREAGSEENA